MQGALKAAELSPLPPEHVFHLQSGYRTPVAGKICSGIKAAEYRKRVHWGMGMGRHEVQVWVWVWVCVGYRYGCGYGYVLVEIWL